MSAICQQIFGHYENEGTEYEAWNFRWHAAITEISAVAAMHVWMHVVAGTVC